MRLSVARVQAAAGSPPVGSGLTAAGAFTERAGGTSLPPLDSLNLGLHVGDDPEAVIENRRRALETLDGGIGLDDMVVGEQVHGSRVVRVGRRHAGLGARDYATAVPGADGLITATKGLCLCVLVADCVPILLFDPKRGAIGAVHAGWRGTAAGIARHAVRSMVKAFGCDPQDIVAAIGPSIGPADYAVGPEVIEAIGAEFASSTHTGRPSIDLRAANQQQLMAAGLDADNIEIDAASTVSDRDRYFSHRAEGGRTGRNAGLIVLL